MVVDRWVEMPIKYILIPVEEETPISVGEVEQGDISAMQRLVGGGHFDALDVGNPPATIWVNDDGKNMEMPMNRRMTLLWWMSAPEMRGHDYIAGPAFITGQPDKNGNTKTVPRSLVNLLFNTKSYKFLMRVPKHPWFASEVHFDNWVDCFDAALSTATAFPLDVEVKVARAD